MEILDTSGKLLYKSATTKTLRKVLKEAIANKVSFAKADLAGADFSEVDFSEANFSEANLIQTNFAAAHLAKTNLTKVNLLEANLAEANLVEASLAEANLTRANLYRACLSWANLAGANLTDAKLVKVNFFNANFTLTDLTGANLRGANLNEANLSDANLSKIKEDFFQVLATAKDEVSGLLQALREGRIDGSYYEGECCCLVGTVAKIRGCDYRSLSPRVSRPAERWFFGISSGDTPENHPVSKITESWILEFQTKA